MKSQVQVCKYYIELIISIEVSLCNTFRKFQSMTLWHFLNLNRICVEEKGREGGGGGGLVVVWACERMQMVIVTDTYYSTYTNQS